MNKSIGRRALWAVAACMAFGQAVSGQQAWPDVAQPRIPPDTFSVLDYGAKGDGTTLNTGSLQAAIRDCHRRGGGVVLLGSGLWLTGPLVLESGVNLHLQRGALLQFTADFDQYPLVESHYEGLEAVRCQAPLSGANLEDIAITGEGVIDGSGGAWRMVKRSKLTASQWQKLVASGGVLDDKGDTWYPSTQSLQGSKVPRAGVLTPGKTAADYADIKDFLRPNLLSLVGCRRVRLEGVTFQNSPAWCLHPLLCQDLSVSGIRVRNPWYAQNGDGIDVESCRNVLIENSSFDVGDDGICLKSGRDEEGRRRGVPTENVGVRGCVVYHAHGGFVIGSEMSGGVRHVRVMNCTFIGTDIGLRFKTTRGRGGIVEDIHASGIRMSRIAGEAIRFDMYYAAKDPVPLAGEQRAAPREVSQPVTEGTPQFRDFDISDIHCQGASAAVFIRGLPEMHIRNIRFRSLVMHTTRGIQCLDADSVRFEGLQLHTRETTPAISLTACRHFLFRGLDLDDSPPGVMQINGTDCADIHVRGPAAAGLAAKTRFRYGASPAALHIP